MSQAVYNLQEWFNQLPESAKHEVIAFLYEGQAFTQGLYYGPNPQIVKFGLYMGPKPVSTQQTSICPTCKRPF